MGSAVTTVALAVAVAGGIDLLARRRRVRRNGRGWAFFGAALTLVLGALQVLGTELAGAGDDPPEHVAWSLYLGAAVFLYALASLVALGIAGQARRVRAAVAGAAIALLAADVAILVAAVELDPNISGIWLIPAVAFAFSLAAGVRTARR
jgi:hypothetical protein